ncbi:MAG TPA: transposase [Anaerovoracaceae bacterium]|nr:transposase [Anaerovoracaceae bacterium]
MDLTITAKLRILPASEEHALLLATMRAYTSACNYVAAYIFHTCDLNPVSLNKALYYDLRARFSLRSQMAQSVLKTVVSRYKAIRSVDNKWVRPIFKKLEYNLVWNRDYSLCSGVFSVNTLEGRIRMAFRMDGMEKYFDGSWTFGTAKLVTRNGKWFLHIPMTKSGLGCSDEDLSNVVGIDLGINFLAVSYNSDGKTVFCPGREIKQRRAEFKQLRKELQQRGTPSARRRLKKTGSRENRWMHDVNHRVSKALVTSSPVNTLFVLEDLTGIRNATERVSLKNRYLTVSWAFYDLRKKLEYKAVLYGSKTIAADPAHTSQTCPKCGHISKDNRDRKNHLFTCKACGYRSNDDRIAAMNLYRKGIEYLSAVADE